MCLKRSRYRSKSRCRTMVFPSANCQLEVVAILKIKNWTATSLSPAASCAKSPIKALLRRSFSLEFFVCYLSLKETHVGFFLAPSAPSEGCSQFYKLTVPASGLVFGVFCWWGCLGWTYTPGKNMCESVQRHVDLLVFPFGINQAWHCLSPIGCQVLRFE